MSIGVSDGGLGFRRATDVALPAFLASRVESRPFAIRLFAAMRASGVVIDGLADRYDEVTAAARAAFLAGLAEPRRGHAERLCAAAAADAEAQAQSMEAADRPSAPGPPVSHAGVAARLVDLAGDEDAECPDSFGSRKLQRGLCRLTDEQQVYALAVGLRSADRRSAQRRIHELRDPTVSVDWMWQLSRAHGSCLEGEDYALAVRMRLGAGGVDSDALCGCCGAAYLGGDAGHCLCCAPAESTRGHNAVRNELLEFACQADATSEIETPGLIAAALGLRPADVLTSVAVVGLASCALDLRAAAPDAAGAGTDCAVTMHTKKTREYQAHLDAMARDGISYVPMVWSAWGREHPETTRVLELIAKRAARRRGQAEHRQILRRARARIGRAVVQWAVAMHKACQPRTQQTFDAGRAADATGEEQSATTGAARIIGRASWAPAQDPEP